MTKLDMARVIVQALYCLPKLPAVDNKHVVKQSRKPKATVEAAYKQAHKIISDGVSAGTWPKA